MPMVANQVLKRPETEAVKTIGCSSRAVWQRIYRRDEWAESGRVNTNSVESRYARASRVPRQYQIIERQSSRAAATNNTLLPPTINHSVRHRLSATYVRSTLLQDRLDERLKCYRQMWTPDLFSFCPFFQGLKLLENPVAHNDYGEERIWGTEVSHQGPRAELRCGLEERSPRSWNIVEWTCNFQRSFNENCEILLCHRTNITGKL